CASSSSRPKKRDRTASTSGASLSTTLPSASSIRTGGSSSSERVASTNEARHASRLGHSFGCFALATLPVSLSRSAYARSPTTPPSLKSAASRSSPNIDLKGKLHYARVVHTL